MRTIALSWGRYGGFYITSGRVCLGWIALTWLNIEIDDLMRWAGVGPRASCDICETRSEPLRRSRYHHDEGVALYVCASCEEDS